MDSSVLIAKFLGPFLMVVGASLFFNKNIFLRIGEDFFKNAALVYVSGAGTFMMGLAIVIFNNIWVADWRAIITVIGWMTLIKGVWIIVLPRTMVKMTDAVLKNINMVLIPWAILFVLGIFLTIKGYS